MKRAKLHLSLLPAALLAAGCGSEPVAGSMASASASNTSSPDATDEPSPDTTDDGTGGTSPSATVPDRPAEPPVPPTNPVPANTGGMTNNPPVGAGGASAGQGGAGGGANPDDCEVVVSFDEAWGAAATGGGTDPMEWETTVMPTIANGVFSVEVPFETSGQQFGWNGDYPSGPVDCTGRELVARVRLLSGFVEDPETMPGGVLMYLFSDEWANSQSAWSNVPAPAEEWFEVSVGCEASADSAFDPSLVNGIGFTFNTGGEDATSYTASSAAFEVDHLCWRSADPGSGGAGGEASGGSGGSAGSGGTNPVGGAGGNEGGAGGEPDAGSGGAPVSDAGVDLDAGADELDASVGGEPGVSDAGVTGGSGGAADGGGSGGMSGGGSGGASGGAGGAGPEDCEIVVGFDTSWGVVGGGTSPEAWEASVDPTIADGVFNVLIPFESATQTFGWVGDHPGGVVDCTGQELVARVRLLSGFVEDPEAAPGGVLMYLFSDSWGNSRSAWNDVPEPSEDWFEASVTCDTTQGSEFDSAVVNGIGFTFNSGGDEPTDYDAAPAEFEVDYLCWRQ